MPAEGQPDLWLIQIIGHVDLDDDDLDESRVKQLQATYRLVADGIIGDNTRSTVREAREFHWPIGGWLGVGEKREDSYTEVPCGRASREFTMRRSSRPRNRRSSGSTTSSWSGSSFSP